MRSVLIVSLASVAGMVLGACGGTVDEQRVEDVADEMSEGSLAADEGQVQVSDIQTVRVYLGETSHVSIDAASPLAYGIFDLQPEGRVQIDLTAEYGTTSGVSFKLYRVTKRGWLRLLRVIEGPQGTATTTLRSRYGGTYVVETAAEGGAAHLALDIACLRRDGQCATLRQPGESCDATGSLECDDGLLCRYEEGVCGAEGGSGTCVHQPEECNMKMMCRPLCGCDGATYCNACEAAKAGTSIAYAGVCRGSEGATCGGFAGLQCRDGLYCRYAEGTCGASDRIGVCAVRPQSCANVYEPVCGCDGSDYENPCAAAAAGVAVASTGACCDPGVWNKTGPVAMSSVRGLWTWSGAKGLYNVSATLTLNEDESYSFVEILEPRCLESITPCAMPTRRLRTDGILALKEGAVQLYPVPFSVPELAETFEVEATCTGDVRLTTTEEGVDEVFVRPVL